MVKMGQVYVEISASVVNEMMGISTLNGSGAGGSEELSFYLTWGHNNGFTGLGWFFDEITALKFWWNEMYSGGNQYVIGGEYENSENGFGDWVSAERPGNLDAALGSWTNSEKLALITDNPKLVSCLTP